jgi:hypothetical protein
MKKLGGFDMTSMKPKTPSTATNPTPGLQHQPGVVVGTQTHTTAAGPGAAPAPAAPPNLPQHTVMALPPGHQQPPAAAPSGIYGNAGLVQAPWPQNHYDAPNSPLITGNEVYTRAPAAAEHPLPQQSAVHAPPQQPAGHTPAQQPAGHTPAQQHYQFIPFTPGQQTHHPLPKHK